MIYPVAFKSGSIDPKRATPETIIKVMLSNYWIQPMHCYRARNSLLLLIHGDTARSPLDLGSAVDLANRHALKFFAGGFDIGILVLVSDFSLQSRCTSNRLARFRHHLRYSRGLLTSASRGVPCNRSVRTLLNLSLRRVTPRNTSSRPLPALLRVWNAANDTWTSTMSPTVKVAGSFGR